MRTILHTVNQSPFDKSCLKQCLQQYQSSDGILLLDNGVYALLPNQPLLQECRHKTIYVIEKHMSSRGIKIENSVLKAEPIDMNDFVRLCTEYDLVQSWY